MIIAINAYFYYNSIMSDIYDSLNRFLDSLFSTVKRLAVWLAVAIVFVGSAVFVLWIISVVASSLGLWLKSI